MDKQTVSLTLIAVMLIGYTFAETAWANDVFDFPISTEPSPSIFVQQEPRLFPTPDGGFIIAWKDYRLGELSYFAQRFDSTGRPVGKNFQVVGNADMAFLPDGTGMAIGARRGGLWPEPEYYNVYGQVFPAQGPPLESFLVDGGIFAMCGTGFWGLDVLLTATFDSYIFGFNWGGIVTLKEFGSSGELKYASENHLRLPETAATISCTSNGRGELALLWFNADPFYTEMPSGVYANFLSDVDTIAVDSVLVQAYTPDYRYQWNAPDLRAIALSDTTFEFFWIDKDSCIVKYVIYNSAGRPIAPIAKIDLISAFFDSTAIKVYNFAFIKRRFGKFGLLTTLHHFPGGYRLDEWNYCSSTHWFDAKGAYLAGSAVDSAQFPLVGDNLVQLTPTVLACPVESSGNISLSTLQEFVWLDSLRINDDAFGANQTTPQIAVMDDRNYFVTWQDEQQFHGRSVDLNGNLVGEEVSFDGLEILFLPNHTAVNIWSRQMDKSKAVAGMTIYDTGNWQPIFIDTLARAEWAKDFILTGLSLADSSIIVLLREGGYRLSIVAYSRNGQKRGQRLISTQAYRSLSLIPVGHDSFWVLWNGDAQLYSSELEPLSSQFSLGLSPPSALYLGQWQFLRAFQSAQYDGISAAVLDTNSIQLRQFPLVNNKHATNISFTMIDTSKFITTWTLEKEVYARVFTISGRPLTEVLKIHADVDAKRDWISAVVNNGKVLFVWSDTRNYGQGYDIYGSIHDLDVITRVQSMDDERKMPSGFSLLQNFPNPFNASTLIRYSLSSPTFAMVEIFNLRGQKVRSLVAEHQPAGNHRVVWDGTDDSATALPSGVYLFRLKAGEKVSMNKAILIR